MPPSWFHHVQSLDVSISVNSWSYSPENDMQQTIMNAFTRAIHRVTDVTEKTKLARIYIRTLIDKVPAPSSRVIVIPAQHNNDHEASFSRLMVETQFQLLFDAKKLPSSLSAQRKNPEFQCGGFDAPLLQRQAQQLEKFVEQSVPLFAKMHESRRDIWLANAIEMIAFWATNAEFIGAFLNECI